MSFPSIESFLSTLANNIPVELIKVIADAIESGVSPDKIMAIVKASMTEAGRVQLLVEFGEKPDELKDAKIERLRAERDRAQADAKALLAAKDPGEALDALDALKAVHEGTVADLQNAAARVQELEAEVAEHKAMLEELTAPPAPVDLADTDPPPAKDPAAP